MNKHGIKAKLFNATSSSNFRVLSLKYGQEDEKKV